MVPDDHEVAHLKCGIGTPRRITNQQGFYSQEFEYPDGENHLCSCITFIKMKTTGHSNNGLTPQISENKLTAVTGYRADGKIRNFMVGNFNGNFYFVCETAQATPQNDADDRLRAAFCLDETYRFINFFQHKLFKMASKVSEWLKA